MDGVMACTCNRFNATGKCAHIADPDRPRSTWEPPPWEPSGMPWVDLHAPKRSEDASDQPEG